MSRSKDFSSPDVSLWSPSQLVGARPDPADPRRVAFTLSTGVVSVAHATSRGFKVTKVVRPIAQFSLASLALWISLTRISDYFHHPVDVAAGGLIGILFACITLLAMFLE